LAKIPGAPDKGTVIVWGYIIFASCVVLVSIGRKIERTLEWANWIMMFVVLGGLLLLDIYIVPGKIWLEGLVGFVSFGSIPRGVDLLLLGAVGGSKKDTRIGRSGSPLQMMK
jgi:hypothetical protein